MNPIFENRVKFLKNKLTEGKDLTDREAWELLNIEVRNNNYNLKNKNQK